MERIAQLLYFMAPAFVADMAPPFARYWRWGNRPISERWLGSHKTVVGFVFGVLAAALTTFAQSRLAWSGALTSYDDWPLLGLLFGVGAMAGDSIKSFFKRRLRIAPGKPWIPADQLDYIAGALALVWASVELSWGDVAIILLLGFAGHFVVTRIGYWLGVRDVKF
ncbi:MAG TPA: CDP-archaeol synthase [Gemmatimonadaceae bacterium]|nr:CDP-archaeol synthase [Gemmatimonadaceae bacterium]